MNSAGFGQFRDKNPNFPPLTPKKIGGRGAQRQRWWWGRGPRAASRGGEGGTGESWGCLGGFPTLLCSPRTGMDWFELLWTGLHWELWGVQGHSWGFLPKAAKSAPKSWGGGRGQSTWGRLVGTGTGEPRWEGHTHTHTEVCAQVCPDVLRCPHMSQVCPARTHTPHHRCTQVCLGVPRSPLV